jgi:phage gpG-like protein
LTNLRNSASRIGDSEAEFGTNVEFAKFHQYGTTNLAARKLVFEPPLFAKRLAQIAANYQAHGKVGKVNTP